MKNRSVKNKARAARLQSVFGKITDLLVNIEIFLLIFIFYVIYMGIKLYQSPTDVTVDGAHLAVLLFQRRYVSCSWVTIFDHKSFLTYLRGIRCDTMAKFCHYCEMGFFTKSALHVDSCPLKLAVKAAKRKRQEEPKENMVQKLPKLSDHEVAMNCH